MDYLRRVQQAHGAAATAGFARNFVVPGMTHCSGGPATDAFDGPAALVQWLARYQAPDRVLAQGSGTLAAALQRPLCPWPQVARYTSSDVNPATSFACR